MQFDPQVHTKEFLMANPNIAVKLAEVSIEFSEHSIAQDIEILGLQNDHGWTVAHSIVLASNRKKWIDSEAAKNFDVLTIRHEIHGQTVAHLLARDHPNWMWSDEAKNMDILQIADHDGQMVVHILAANNPMFPSFEEFRKPTLLGLKDGKGNTVAYYALKNVSALEYPEFKDKSILGLEHQFKRAFKSDQILQLAEIITIYHTEYNASKVAMILIEQGAAYKQSDVFEYPEFDNEILSKTKNLIDDSLDPLMSLKYAMAFYSTCFHATKNTENKALKAPSHDVYIDLKNWQKLQEQAKELIENIFIANPNLYDISHEPDLNCEPAMDLISHLIARRHFSKVISEVNQSENGPEQTIGLY